MRRVICGRALWAGLALAVLCCAGARGEVRKFEDVTAQVGLTGWGGGAAAWGDFDNDGWTDVYVSGALWRNEKGKKFTKVSDVPLTGGGGLWGDFDNDGLLDLYCWDNGKLFRNLGSKGFKDVSAILPKRPMEVSRGAVWGDFNGDGFIDLYIGGYERWKAQKEYPDVIFLNESGKAFREVWRTKGRPHRARGITASDFDEDGDLDVYVSNYRLQVNQLWRNDGGGVWTDVAEQYGMVVEKRKWKGHTIGSAFGDFDNDGHFDLFIGNFSHSASYQDRPVFLRNLGPEGKWHFENKSAAVKLRWQESYASPSLADFDNDGNLDFFFTTVYSGDRSVLYRNDGGWKFTDVTKQAGVATANTYQSSWADFDNDGHLDLASGGRLFRNPGTSNHWLKVKLVGSGKVNRAAIGSQVRIRLGDRTLLRQVEGATGEGNQNDLTLHFGLGRHTGNVTLDIAWTDGSRQQVVSPVDRRIVVRKAEPGIAPPPEPAEK